MNLTHSRAQLLPYTNVVFSSRAQDRAYHKGLRAQNKSAVSYHRSSPIVNMFVAAVLAMMVAHWATVIISFAICYVSTPSNQVDKI
jgi:hypothetical protein